MRMGVWGVGVGGLVPSAPVVFEFEITKRENLYAGAACSCAPLLEKFHLFKASCSGQKSGLRGGW